MKEFSCATRIVMGSGSVAAVKELGAKRLFMVADPFFAENGTAQRIVQLSGAEHWEIFSEVAPDPTVALAARGTARVREFDPDVIVALGGGSAMDCAKAMAYFSGSKAKLVAIPTTSGSGSEVTDFAILTHEGVKHPLVDGRLCPDMAILDDELLTKLPKGLVADAGFDVLSHALEAYVAKDSTPITDALARDAFCRAFDALPLSFSGRQSARTDMHTAATMAGMAFTRAGLGMCHAIAHSLGGQFHIPHGRLNAILLPAVIGCNVPEAGEKYAQLARAAGFSGSADVLAVRNLKNGLIRLRRELDMPDTLARAGVEPRLVWQKTEVIVAGALEDPCCRTNPVPVTEAAVRQVLEAVTGRG